MAYDQQLSDALRELEQVRAERDALAAHVEAGKVIVQAWGDGEHSDVVTAAKLAMWTQDAPTTSLARLRGEVRRQVAEEWEVGLPRIKAEWQAEGALAIRHLTQGDDWEDDDLRAVIDDYIAELRRQAEGGE